jgi:energy-coupling factor transporter ATP-binding protein EcfA2
MILSVSHFNCENEKGDTLFRDVSFSVSKRDRIAIIGDRQELGTVLCYLCAGIASKMLPAYSLSGDISYRKKPIEAYPSHDRIRQIAYVPANADLLISGVKETVFSEIALSLELRGTDPQIIRDRVNATLRSFGIGHLAGRDPDELSGGERHKIALASMVIREPEVLIMDNPSLFLDTSGVVHLANVLRSYPGVVIIADPNPYLWSSVAERFILLKPPDIEEVPSPASLLEELIAGRIHFDTTAWIDFVKRSRAFPEETTVHSLHALSVIKRLRSEAT